ncbi:MAG: ADOP family duplicated permease [Gemmatimonadaceae bacterium]
MGLMQGIGVRLRALLRPATTDRDLDDEIHLHLELEAEKYRALGMSEADARRKALLAFGGVAQAREAHREVRTARWIEETRRDVRIALRALARRPAVSIAAVLTLALGIGATTAIFSVVNAVILRPLPFAEPGRLVMLWEENPDFGWYQQSAAPANVLDWRERVRAFDDVAAYAEFEEEAILTGEGEPRLLYAALVTGNLFDVLGVRALHGRTLRDEETWSTAERAVVISHRAWRTHLGGDTAVIENTIQLDGQPFRVVGVMRPSFAFPFERVDVWMPMRWNPQAKAFASFRRAHWLRAIARLEPGVTPMQANAELEQVAARLMEEYPATNTRMGAGLTPLHEFLVGSTRTPLFIVLGAVAILLVIACVNVGNLLLVAAAGRERESALRLVLGAGRLRLARQALTESFVLAAVGGAAGLALGWAGTGALAALQPEGLLRVSDVPLDGRVLLFVLAVTMTCGLLFGVAPTLWSGRRVPAEALREGGRTGSDGHRVRRWGSTLVVAEVAMAFVLTVGAGLLVRSYRTLQNVDPGFDASGVLAASLALPESRYDTNAKLDAFWEELVRRARGLPGAEHAAVVRKLPLSAPSWSSQFVARGWEPGRYGVEVVHREVSPGYFETMGVPLVRGRDFTEADRADGQPVVIVNEALADVYFPGEDAIGKVIAFDQVPDSNSVWRTIVGVVGSERQGALAAPPRHEIFAPITQDRTPGMALVLRTTGAPSSLAPGVHRIVAELDPLLAFTSIQPMSDVRDAALARDRFFMTLLLAFAGVGLVLALIGVYGVLAQLVSGRRREIGIRVALGAQPAQLRWAVVRRGLALTTAGLVLGGAVALVSTRALGSLLYEVTPADPFTFAVVTLLLVLTSVVAAWQPARRASAADPVEVLRNE